MSMWSLAGLPKSGSQHIVKVSSRLVWNLVVRYISSVTISPSGSVSAVNSRDSDTNGNLQTLWDELPVDQYHPSAKLDVTFPRFKESQSWKGLWLGTEQSAVWVASCVGSMAPNLSRYRRALQFEKPMYHCRRVRLESFHSVRWNSEATTLPLDSVKRRPSRGGKYEKLWRDLFADPSNWWDNRSGKPNDRFPDFKHKQSGKGLWLKNALNPSWVASEIGAISPGVSIFSRSQKLSAYNKAKQYEKTIEFFYHMQKDGQTADSYEFVHALNACAGLEVLKEGQRIHEQIMKAGYELDLHLGSSLVDMYVKCGSIGDAWGVFKKMPNRNVVAWAAMILGCAKCGQEQEAFELFKQMQLDGVSPDSFTFVGILNACANIAALEEGQRIHEQIVRAGLESDLYVGSSLVDMYARCGSIEDAEWSFKKLSSRDVVSWTALIQGCVKCGHGMEALKLFQDMQLDGVQPNHITLVALLNACANISALDEGRQIHKQIVQRGFESTAIVGNALVDMYIKCGSIEDARTVFENMPIRDVVSWNAMIRGWVKCGQGQHALEMFQQMNRVGIDPDHITFVTLLNACASMAALEAGRSVHELIIRSGSVSYENVGSSLVDMYAKCGSIENARSAFDNMANHDVVSWTAMLMGYAIHGQAKEAIALFEQMVSEGVEVDELVFVCLLSACNHGGLWKEGLQYFESMRSVYGLLPKQDHYICMVDLLGRAGHLDDAEKMIKTMHLEASAAVWMSLLSACRIHGDVEMGKRVAEKVLQLNADNAAGYVLLSNIYAAAGHFDMQGTVYGNRLEKKAGKSTGSSWIEVENTVHSFVEHDRKHPKIKEILAELDELSKQMVKAGYVPDISCSLQNDPEETKIAGLCGHSEKMAIAFGLLSTSAGAPLQIAKNLRVCGDCHTAIKFISKITGRDITIRDASRFHHFKDGHCSCREFW